MDTLNGKFPGYTFGDRWNGWATPFFTKDVGMRIVKAHSKGSARYDPRKDAFVFRLDPDAPDLDVFEGEIVEGKKLYPIGSYYWIWEEEGDFD